MKVLAGDVGGTNTRLALCEVADNKVLRLTEEVEPSNPHESLGSIVQRFVTTHRADDVRAACFGLPGPVRGRQVRLTNLPWELDADQLERELGLRNVTFLNDLAANAYGLRTLDTGDLHTVRAGNPDMRGNQGLLSAGTGLGQAGLHFVGERWIPFATEGGHADFAPSNGLEFDLLEFLQAKHGGHVSWERVVAGPGLHSIYEFFRTRETAPEPTWLRDELKGGDPSAAIARVASEARDPNCTQALALFLELLGAEASNLALKVLATGGIFLGGGIAPALIAQIKSSAFLARFDAKGRMRELVEEIPIKIINNDKAALQGAAFFAAHHASPG